MKKIFLALFCLTASLQVAGQTTVGRFAITPKVGADMATMIDNTYFSVNYWTIEPKWKVGLVAGVEAEWQMFKRSSLSAGVLYAQQGCRWGDVDNERKGVKLQLHYLNVPVMENLYVLPHLALKAGVQFSFSLSDRISYNQMATSVMDANNPDKKLWERKSYDAEGYKKFDISIPVGVAYDYHDVIFDLRYHFGLNSMSKTVSGINNHMVMLTIGSRIEL